MAERGRRQLQPNVRLASLTDLGAQATQSGEQPVAAPAAAEPTMSKRKKGNEPVQEKQSGNEEEEEEEAAHPDCLDEAAETRPETAAKEGELETTSGPAKKKGRTANVKPPFQNASQQPLESITSVKGCPVMLTNALRFVQNPDTELLVVRVGDVLRAYFQKAAARNTDLIVAAIYKKAQGKFWRCVFVPLRADKTLGAPLDLPAMAVMGRAPGEVSYDKAAFSGLATELRAELTAPPAPVPARPLAVRHPKRPRTPAPAAPTAAGVVTPYVADLAPHIETLATVVESANRLLANVRDVQRDQAELFADLTKRNNALYDVLLAMVSARTGVSDLRPSAEPRGRGF
jgi:hypothetical protein